MNSTNPPCRLESAGLRALTPDHEGFDGLLRMGFGCSIACRPCGATSKDVTADISECEVGKGR